MQCCATARTKRPITSANRIAPCHSRKVRHPLTQRATHIHRGIPRLLRRSVASCATASATRTTNIPQLAPARVSAVFPKPTTREARQLCSTPCHGLRRRHIGLPAGERSPLRLIWRRYAAVFGCSARRQFPHAHAHVSMWRCCLHRLCI